MKENLLLGVGVIATIINSYLFGQSRGVDAGYEYARTIFADSESFGITAEVSSTIHLCLAALLLLFVLSKFIGNKVASRELSIEGVSLALVNLETDDYWPRHQH